MKSENKKHQFKSICDIERDSIIAEMKKNEISERKLSIYTGIPLSTIRSYIRGGDTASSNYLTIKNFLQSCKTSY